MHLYPPENISQHRCRDLVLTLKEQLSTLLHFIQPQPHMPPFNIQPRALRPSGALLRAGFATSKPRCRALTPGPCSTLRRSPPPTPPSKRPSKQPQSSPNPLKKLPDPPKEEPSSLDAVSSALRNSDSNNLLSAVHIPNDPNGVLTPDHPATSILSNSAIVVTRQLELMNVMLGFEQANKYVIMDPQGNHIGYMAERDLGMGNMMARQIFSTHRSFTTHIFDRQGKEVLRVCRLGHDWGLRADLMLVSPAFCMDIKPDWYLRSYDVWKALVLVVCCLDKHQSWRPFHQSERRIGPTLASGFVRYANHRRSTAAVGPVEEEV